jgi:eukaryotic-like serine/threonine-protein kinase
MATPAQNLLKPGDSLGPYRIDSLLGKGGMGEVYRATDMRLGRPVAIKISAREFSDRFEREAIAISSLNHPHVCTLYDVGSNYLVMELVEGDTLAHWIKQGPMPLETVLLYAIQIADALSAAHAKGIIHRDLKPANIILTKTGVKVLDFGLAKLGPAKFSASRSSEVETQPMTEPGSISGTPQYMSPEQVEGKAIDERSDIFAFGAVMYEMLTGRRAFDGETKTAVLAGILKDQPAPIQQFQPQVPQSLDRVVRKCLEKKAADRWHSAHDLKQTLELIDLTAPAGASASASSGIRVAPPSARRKWLWSAIAAVVLIAAGAGLLRWAPWRSVPPVQPVRFEVGPSDKITFYNQARMAISPDGRWMAFIAEGDDGKRRYYLRALDGVEVRALPGTEGNENPPAWSYDSRWLLFANRENDKLKKIDSRGGPPQTIADFPGLLTGASSNPDGVIIAGSLDRQPHPILRVSASEGQMTPVTDLAPGDTAHRWPQFLPDRKHFLYLVVSSDPDRQGVFIGSLDAKPEQQSKRRLLATDRQAYYAPSPGGGAGHLLFLRGNTLMAQNFDPREMTLSGDPMSVAEGIDTYSDANDGLFEVSETGTLVYRVGPGVQNSLTWFDQQGNPAGTIGDPGEYGDVAISPDGSRVAAAMGLANKRDIWILDVARGTSTRFTFDSRDTAPIWSPDSKYIAFTSNRSGKLDLYIKPADGSGEEKLLLKTDEEKYAECFTRDGRFLLFDSLSQKTQWDMWALPFPVSGDAKPISLLKTQFSEAVPAVAPDGRWLAYASDESGSFEVYVRPFTPDAPVGTGAKWLVSKGGGGRSRWRPGGKGLFYLGPNSQMMAVDIDTSKGFQAGTPHRIFGAARGSGTWDLSPDGKRFLFVAPAGTSRVAPYTVVLNWAAGLKK